MRALSASELLCVWERYAEEPPESRSLALLLIACGDRPAEDIARMSIGERDGHLLNLRESMFGPGFACLTTCPGCSSELEMNFDTSEIQVPHPSPVDSPLTVESGGYCVRFRLPNGLDVAELGSPADSESIRAKLLERCVLEARFGERSVSTFEFPEDLTKRISERMAEADPQANIDFALECAHCSHAWLAPFNIVSVLWSEIHAWAVRLLRDVHDLAWAYGWREAEILAFSPRRRGLYLELIRA